MLDRKGCWTAGVWSAQESPVPSGAGQPFVVITPSPLLSGSIRDHGEHARNQQNWAYAILAAAGEAAWHGEPQGVSGCQEGPIQLGLVLKDLGRIKGSGGLFQMCAVRKQR